MSRSWLEGDLKRRITIRTDAGVQHYEVVQVERTTVANTYRLRIESRDATCILAKTPAHVA